jgi:hypothetical protein
MSKIRDRHPHIRTIGSTADGTTNPGELLALIQPYLDWRLAELESGDSILIFNPAAGKPTGELVESIVILRGEAAKAWLRHIAHPPSQDNYASASP